MQNEQESRTVSPLRDQVRRLQERLLLKIRESSKILTHRAVLAVPTSSSYSLELQKA